MPTRSNRYVPLGRFLEEGRLPLDNGEVERLIRLIVLGRNAYFRDVLPKLGGTLFPASRLAELLPESWAQQQAQQR
ncbi:transposase [Cystobacter fuscus]|uniref:IS66 family transposase n=1 Tax=Cystobacter fuscus TaxID=43 RepID=UPI0037BFBD3E